MTGKREVARESVNPSLPSPILGRDNFFLSNAQSKIAERIEEEKGKGTRLLLAAIGVIMMALPGYSATIHFTDMLPAEIHGWRAVGPGAMYDHDTLYEYINGGAEVYRSFNVRKVLARRYEKEGAPAILADVFDMGSSKDAFGAYNHDLREGTEVEIGQESELLGSSLAFWKDRFFVSVIAFDETEESKRAVLALGHVVAEAIPNEGHTPDLLQLLPQKDLSRQVQYFHNHFCLNTYYFLAKKNLLNLSQNTEGVLARYDTETTREEKTPSSPVILVLIRYPSLEEAGNAHDQFLQGYLPDADSQGMVQTENTRWAAVDRTDKLLIGVFDAPSKNEILAIVNAVCNLRNKSRGGTGR